MTKRLFVDMDGTLARFHDEVNYLERMWEQGFFLNLKPFQEMIDSIKLLKKETPEIEVYILSAAIDGFPPFCQKEKHQWLDKHLPEVDSLHRIFTKVGDPKSSYIPGGIDREDYLLDDYNKNLDEWIEFGGSSIKCVNNINHKGLIGPIWSGELVRADESPSQIKEQIYQITEKKSNPGILKNKGAPNRHG